MDQRIISPENDYSGLDAWTEGKKCIFIVCGKTFSLPDSFNRKLERITASTVFFSDFCPNPLYRSVVEGVRLFREAACDAIMAVGGGSAIDVAKCIKLYSGRPGNGENGAWLTYDGEGKDIPFLAMPTTAGTGSEATRYAVIYYDGKKQSITSDSIIPETVLFDPGPLKTLPLYQKKATMCDALCHAIESFWSINSTEESREYSKVAIRGIMEHMDGYLANSDEGCMGMLAAANIAGKAINIAQTTAGHAMCYKITGLFGCAHGHAAILCDRVLYSWMAENVEKCTDPRGIAFFERILNEIAEAMGCKGAAAGAERLDTIFEMLRLDIPYASAEQFKELKTSVNPIRLQNNPVIPDEETVNMLYHRILGEKTCM